jgi:uncharacterized lipoprotein YmbA
MRAFLLACLMSSCLAACGRSTMTSYYVLKSAPPAEQSAGGELSVWIGPVRLPGFLDRVSIVTEEGPHRLALSESHLWAEPLGESVARVLGKNLTARLGSEEVRVYPAAAEAEDHRLEVEILELLGGLGGDAVIEARWTVSSPDGRSRTTERASFTLPAGADHGSLAAAFSRLLAAVSDRVAESLAR